LNFSLFIAQRYLKSASKNNAINIINKIASLGIIAGSMSLFVVLSVFSGLINFSLSFSNAVDPDLKAFTTLGKSFFISEEQKNQIKKIEGIAAFSKVVEERVLFVFNGKEQVASLKGVDSIFTQVSTIKKNLFSEQWIEPNTNQVIVGAGISQKLSLGLLDAIHPLEAFVPKPGTGSIDMNTFTSSKLYPIGIYGINEDLDTKYVFSDLLVAQELLGYQPNQISNLEFKLQPNTNQKKVIEQLQTIFNNQLTIKNREQLNDALNKMLNTENVAVYLIFTLVIIVALFNLIGALIMMILEKKGNLKTLFNLGVEVKNLRKIFLYQGTLLSVIGGAIGLLLGILIVLLQKYFQLIMITPQLAYPVEFTMQNVLIVACTICTLGFFASLIASSRVSKKLLE
jgi:lipoprotein-releasing system permease protein